MIGKIDTIKRSNFDLDLSFDRSINNNRVRSRLSPGEVGIFQNDNGKEVVQQVPVGPNISLGTHGVIRDKDKGEQYHFNQISHHKDLLSRLPPTTLPIKLDMTSLFQSTKSAGAQDEAYESSLMSSSPYSGLPSFMMNDSNNHYHNNNNGGNGERSNSRDSTNSDSTSGSSNTSESNSLGTPTHSSMFGVNILPMRSIKSPMLAPTFDAAAHGNRLHRTASDTISGLGLDITSSILGDTNGLSEAGSAWTGFSKSMDGGLQANLDMETFLADASSYNPAQLPQNPSSSSNTYTEYNNANKNMIDTSYNPVTRQQNPAIYFNHALLGFGMTGINPQMINPDPFHSTFYHQLQAVYGNSTSSNDNSTASSSVNQPYTNTLLNTNYVSGNDHSNNNNNSDYAISDGYSPTSMTSPFQPSSDNDQSFQYPQPPISASSTHPRRISDSFVSASSQSRRPEESRQSVSKRGRKRKSTWTAGDQDDGIDIDLSSIVDKKERRRMQNRLAQRAFRARSKLQQAEKH